MTTKRGGKKKGPNKEEILRVRTTEHNSIAAAIAHWAQASLRKFLETISRYGHGMLGRNDDAKCEATKAARSGQDDGDSKYWNRRHWNP